MTYTRSDAAPKADPITRIRRIVDAMQPTGDQPAPTYRCHVCRDVGMVELTEGTKFTLQSGATIKVPAYGPGVFQKCSGYQGQPCRYRAWRREEASKQQHDEKAGSSEKASL